MLIYYVYAYLRKKDLTPYYIGKGKGKRAFQKHNVVIPKDKTRIVFLETNLTNIGACALERRYIRWYGRKDNKTGILRNLTDGGEGTPGKITSEECRRKQSQGRLGQKHSEETKKKLKAAVKNRKPVSDETKEKLRIANKRRIRKPHSEETRKKISEANKRRAPASLETRRKISESGKGRKMNDYTKQRLKEVNEGRKHSEETKIKMRESALKRWNAQQDYDLPLIQSSK